MALHVRITANNSRVPGARGGHGKAQRGAASQLRARQPPASRHPGSRPRDPGAHGRVRQVLGDFADAALAQRIVLRQCARADRPRQRCEAQWEPALARQNAGRVGWKGFACFVALPFVSKGFLALRAFCSEEGKAGSPTALTALLDWRFKLQERHGSTDPRPSTLQPRIQQKRASCQTLPWPPPSTEPLLQGAVLRFGPGPGVPVGPHVLCICCAFARCARGSF